MSLWRRIAFAAALSAAAAGCGQAEPGDGTPGKARSDLADDSSGGVITSVGLVGLDGEQLGAFMTNHAARLQLKIRTNEASAPHHLAAFLIRENAASLPDSEPRTCVLGDWTVTYGAGEDGEDATFELDERVVIPAECLSSGSSGAVFNLGIGKDHLMEYEADEAAAAGQPPPKGYGTQFFNDEALDLDGLDRNHLCKGPHGEKSCVAHLKVGPSAGHNLEVSALITASSIGTIDKACSLDGALPLFNVTTRLRLDGSPSHDGKTKNEAPYNTLAEITPEPVVLHYSICPRDPDGSGSGGCAPQTTWAPLGIGSNNGLVDQASITELAADQPNESNHPLYVASDSVTCGRINGTGADESWLGYSTFNLRACAELPIDETRNGDDDGKADNCFEVPVQILRSEADPGADAQATSLHFYKTYVNSYGGNVVGVNVDFGTDSTLNLSGATTHNWAKADSTSWFTTNLVDIHADAAAYVSLVGSYVNAGVNIFGTNYWSYAQTVNNINTTWSKSYTKSYCLAYGYGILGLSFNVSGCLAGTAGIDVAFKVVAQNGNGPAPFASSTRIGVAQATALATANLTLNLSASANIAVLKGGISGSALLANFTLPASGKLLWGLINFAGKPALVIQADTKLSLKLDTLSGSVFAWVEALKPEWCKGKLGIGHPCFSWSSIYNQNIVAWNGWSSSLISYSLGGQWMIQ